MLLKDPIVSVNDVALRSFSLQNLTLDVMLCVNNPNPVGISLKSLSFELYYHNQNKWVFLSDGHRETFTIKSGSNEIIIPATVSNASLLTAIIGMIAQGAITIRISGIAQPDLLVFTPKVPFSREMTIPLTFGDHIMGIPEKRHH
jgi:LEA14-like dessication related protein